MASALSGPATTTTTSASVTNSSSTTIGAAGGTSTTTSTTHHEQPPESPHPHAMMTSDEVDAMVHSYLSESGYTHTAFSLLHESALAGPSSSSSYPINGRKNAVNAVLDHSIPPGHLVRILQKGLLYLEAEARYRGDPKEPSPRLIGYTIPNTLPLPPLPKVVHKQPSPAAPSTSTSTAPMAAPSQSSASALTASTSSSSTAPSTSTSATSTESSKSATTSIPTTTAKSEKAKGKEKESTNSHLNGKRKGSDREDSTSETGKRPKTGDLDGEKKKKSIKVNGNHAANDDAMEVDLPPPSTTTNSLKRSNGAGGHHSAGSTPRSLSPVVQRKPKSSSDQISNHKKRPSSISSATPISFAASEPNSPSESNSKESNSLKDKSNDRRTSLPEGEQKTQAELMKIKNEDGEPQPEGKKKKKRGPKPSNGPAGKSAPSSTAEVDTTVDTTRAAHWSSEKGPVRLLQGHSTAKVQACTWNPKVPSLLATGANDSTCRIWDVPTSRAPAGANDREILKDNIVLKHASAQRRVDVSAIAWDPTGSLLATGSEDGIVRVWTPSGDLHLVLSMHQRAILSLQWNRLGTMLLTGSYDGTVCLWEISSGKVKQQWATHADSVLHLDWNDDQTFASASSDKTIHLFNVSRVTPVYRFKGHKDDVNFVKFSPCGTMLASVSDDHSVRLWSLRNIPGLVMDDPKAFTAKDEDRLIDSEDNGGQLVLDGHEADVHAIAWSPLSSSSKPRLVASAAFDNTARLWDADAGTCLHVFAFHTDWLYSISFSPGGSFLATGSNDGKLHVWRVKDRSLALDYTHTGPVYELSWKANGKQIAVCGKSHDVGVVDFDETEAAT